MIKNNIIKIVSFLGYIFESIRLPIIVATRMMIVAVILSLAYSLMDGAKMKWFIRPTLIIWMLLPLYDAIKCYLRKVEVKQNG